MTLVLTATGGRRVAGRVAVGEAGGLVEPCLDNTWRALRFLRSAEDNLCTIDFLPSAVPRSRVTLLVLVFISYVTCFRILLAESGTGALVKETREDRREDI